MISKPMVGPQCMSVLSFVFAPVSPPEHNSDVFRQHLEWRLYKQCKVTLCVWVGSTIGALGNGSEGSAPKLMYAFLKDFVFASCLGNEM